MEKNTRDCLADLTSEDETKVAVAAVYLEQNGQVVDAFHALTRAHHIGLIIDDYLIELLNYNG
jgi:hypothetical protein